MERPSKRIRLSEPVINLHHDTKRPLFLPDMGLLGKVDTRQPSPTRTRDLMDFQRRGTYNGNHARAGQVQQRSPARRLRPRDEAVTVTANVVQVNVNDGTTVSQATIVSVLPTDIVVSLDVGSLTIAGTSSDATDSSRAKASTTTSGKASSTEADSDSSLVVSSTVIASTTSSIATDSILTSTSSTISAGHNSTDSTITVTATSTIEINYRNGTLLSVITETETESNRPTQTFTINGSTITGFDDPIDSSSVDVLGAPPVQTAVNGQGSGITQATSSASATSNPDSGSGLPSLTPEQQQMVGGVVGGVAGVAIILLILLVVMRWYRQRLKSQGLLPEQLASRALSNEKPSSFPASQRSSTVPLAATISSSLARFRPHSTYTVATTATNTTTASRPESERGFQRIAGRKIAPVLSVGGDGYGNSYGAFEKDVVTTASEPLTSNRGSLIGSSGFSPSAMHGNFPRPSHAGDADAISQISSHGPLIVSRTRDFAGRNNSQHDLNHTYFGPLSPTRSLPMMTGKADGMAIMRPSPARTPVTLSPSSSSIRLAVHNHPEFDSSLPPTPAVPSEYSNSRAASDSSLRPMLSPGRPGPERSASRMSKRSGRFTEDVG